MSANVVRIDSDYKIQVGTGNSITLDTGGTGAINIVGNLNVTGTNTVITTTNLSIEDNILTLNRGETYSSISEGKAGIEIDRGTNSDGNAQFFFDETLSWQDPVTNLTRDGLFVFKTNVGGINGIRTTSINTNGNNLNLINSGYGVMSVAGTIDYENQVTDDDHIPNKRYVDQRFASVSAVSNVLETLDTTEATGLLTGSLIAHGGGSISKNLYVGGYHALSFRPSDPTADLNAVKIYAKNSDLKTTGIYFVNNTTQGELVSKSKALLYSLVFG